MSETSYKNRRGHKMSIGDAIDDIAKQDSQPLVVGSKSSSPAKSTQKTAKKKTSFRFKFPRIKRLYWLILLFIIALVLGYGLMMTDGVKRDYERQAALMQRQVTEISKSTSSAREAGSEVAKQLNNQLNASSDCKVEVLSGAHWYGPAKQARQDCQKIADNYNQLKSNLTSIEAESQYAESVRDILRDPLKNPTEGDFASIGDYEGRWHKAVEELNKLTVPGSLEDAHKMATSRVEAVAKQWKALVQAHADEDKANFTAAEKSLSETYVKLREIDQEIIKPINDRQVAIDGLVDSLTIKE